MLAGAAVALGVAVLVYRGPGQPVVRGHVGDVAATMLVFAVVSLVWRARVAWRAAATMGIATAIEVGQVWLHARSTAGHLVFGSTFDPVDFVAYVAGVAIGVIVWNLRWTSDPAGTEPRCSAPAGSRSEGPSAPEVRESSIARSTSSSGAKSR